MAKYKNFNLEQGMPSWETAERRLNNELSDARRTGVKVLKVIHGYGSSGAGGSLRTETRRLLSNKMRSRFIKDYIPGEQWNRNMAKARGLLQTFPEMKKDADLDRCNEGVTLVILP